MRKGELAAYGTPLELKSEFGSALQFTILVERQDVEKTNASILKYFDDCIQWVKVDSGEAGNITVKIERIKQQLEEDEGVDVQVLADFVAWLENKEVSKVSEYGFSNSSLEEVFLKVTDSKEEDTLDIDSDEVEQVDVCCSYCSASFLRRCLSGPLRCCCSPKPRVVESHAQAENEALEDPEDPGLDNDAMGAAVIASFQPVLNVGRQTLTLLRFSLLRNWARKESTGSWIFYSLFVFIALLVGFQAAGSNEPAPYLLAPVIFLSLMLVNLVSPIYADRNLSLFYLMRTQGLMKTSYVLGTSTYALIVQFIFAFVLLSLFFATPLFRSPDLCSYATDATIPCYGRSFGDPRLVSPDSIYWWNDEFNNEAVRLSATWGAGSYGRIFGSITFFALAAPGSVLASAYIPGYKFALVFVVFATLVVSVLPMVYYFKFTNQPFEDLSVCQQKICNVPLENFDIDSVASMPTAFLNCAGLTANQRSVGSLCIPSSSAILPQFGLFQTLMTTLLSEIVFFSDPPEYVQQVLIPALGDSVECSGNTCRFPFARQLYGENLGYMLLGAIILLVLGFAQVAFFSFPEGAILRAKNFISVAFRQVRFCVWSPKASSSVILKDISEPMEEVVKEEELVTSLIQHFLKQRDAEAKESGQKEKDIEIEMNNEAIPREELPPVLMHKLRKVYPSLGGLQPTIALEGLDLHVPKGQVLGLLGKNGAGECQVLLYFVVGMVMLGRPSMFCFVFLRCSQLICMLSLRLQAKLLRSRFFLFHMQHPVALLLWLDMMCLARKRVSLNVSATAHSLISSGQARACGTI
jgi:ABC-type multidrug transport system fused ATPase/permease subunit